MLIGKEAKGRQIHNQGVRGIVVGVRPQEGRPWVDPDLLSYATRGERQGYCEHKEPGSESCEARSVHSLAWGDFTYG